ncbi:hypothetical protein J1N35_001032 [Gossypium stocksii]|uniref:Uncharacterized protein n=1 Tax=Gossypium stocksii TaxID=47602 RepID=A0A9D3WI36_9ROSI|nr:hypothetical protein J1N35_001032 [Gossypium stocksii]
MTLIVIAFLYAAGAKFTLLVAWKKGRPNVSLLFSSSVEYWHRSIYNDFKSYASLILDDFLLPQQSFTYNKNLVVIAFLHPDLDRIIF